MTKRDFENIFEIKALPRFLRSPQAAAVLVGFTGLFNPGLWGSINSIGAGGITDATVSNTANAILFGTLAVAGFITPSITNRLGVKQALIIGASFYSPYAGALYYTSRHPSNKWFLPFSAFLLGISAAHLWVASGSILLGYPLPHQKGKNMSIKFSLQNCGGLIGGIVLLAMNHDNGSQKSRVVSSATFLVLTFLILCGFPMALLLPTPRQVIRTDGSPVILRKQPSFLKEFDVLGRTLRNWRVLVLLPVFVYNQWFLSYQSSFNAHHFTVRARALNSFLSHLLAAIGAWIAGFVLDNNKVSRPARAKIGYVLFATIAFIFWVMQTVVQAKWQHNTRLYDWGGFGAFIFSFWGFVDGSINTLLYWTVGTLTDNVNELSMLSGVINGIGSVGSAMAFVLAAKKVDIVIQEGVNAGLYFFCVPFFAVVAWSVKETPVFELTEDSDAEKSFGRFSNEDTSEVLEKDLKETSEVRVAKID